MIRRRRERDRKLLEGAAISSQTSRHRAVPEEHPPRTEQGKGFLGALTSDSEESTRLGNNLNSTLVSLNSIMRKVETGHGLVGKLLIDEKYGKQTGDSIQAALHSIQTVFGSIETSLKTNTGAIPALLADPEGKKKVYALVDNLSTAAGSLGNVIQQLEKGHGTLSVLLRDEQFSKEFTGNLRSFTKSLDSIGRKLDTGHGTAGKLINDPAIFDAANHVIIGLNESAMLRWLIRDRQKSGINKTYKTEGGPSPVPDEAPVSPSPGPTLQPTRPPS
jgi:hypothetical protein